MQYCYDLDLYADCFKYVHAFCRCKCNGHANECYLPENQVADNEVCRCQHNTGGVNCETCLPLYNDRPWARATESSANECQRECLLSIVHIINMLHVKFTFENNLPYNTIITLKVHVNTKETTTISKL